jgi:[pyruvate, water dikinase]-phosphate phosphotransferase / [pyruvate, water dikinase] kinase
MSDEQKLTIFILSDGTGETADQMMKAALVQYQRGGLKIVRYKNIRTESQVAAIFEEAYQVKAIVVFTVVSNTLRSYIEGLAAQSGIPTVDLLGPLLGLLGNYLEKDPHSQPGLFHQVNEYYFKRIEAIEFTVKHDDGKYADNLRDADIVLVGLSRTSKTPLSIYLSYKGWKVANVPVVKDIPPPDALFEIDQRKIVGLTIEAETLIRIRRERLIKMGQDPTGPYANLDYVQQEIDYCKEETAAEVERVIRTAFPEKFPANP